VTYSRPPFPRPLFARFAALAASLGYPKRGGKWKLLERLLEFAEDNSDLFRKT